MSSERPGLSPKEVAQVGGRPSRLVVAADGSRLLVFHDEPARVTVLDPRSLRVLAEVPLGALGASAPVYRGQSGNLVLCAGSGGRFALFDVPLLALREAISCDGEGVEGAALPDGSRTFLAAARDGKGVLERRLGPGLREADRLALPGRPVPGSLRLCPRLGLGAILARPAAGEEQLLLWGVEPFRLLAAIPVGGGAGALAFSSCEDLLFVARPDDSEVWGLSLPQGRRVRRIVMLGRAFQLAEQPVDPGVWALSGNLPHLVRADLPLGAGPAPVRLEGLDPEHDRLRFSPGGRLAILPGALSGDLRLIDMHPEEGGYGTVADRLELGRDLVDTAWSPFGDEVYVASPDGAVLSFAVDHANRAVRDTADYLASPLLRRALENPLFPP